MQVLVLYLNQQNVKEHHVHLWRKNNVYKTTLTQQGSWLFFFFLRDNIDIYEPILVWIIVSALDVDDDEGKNSLDKSRLTIFNGSNCLNCGIEFFSDRIFSPNSSSNGSSNVIVFIIVRGRFVSSIIKSLIDF